MNFPEINLKGTSFDNAINVLSDALTKLMREDVKEFLYTDNDIIPNIANMCDYMDYIMAILEAPFDRRNSITLLTCDNKGNLDPYNRDYSVPYQYQLYYTDSTKVPFYINPTKFWLNNWYYSFNNFRNMPNEAIRFSKPSIKSFFDLCNKIIFDKEFNVEVPNDDVPVFTVFSYSDTNTKTTSYSLYQQWLIPYSWYTLKCYEYVANSEPIIARHTSVVTRHRHDAWYFDKDETKNGKELIDTLELKW